MRKYNTVLYDLNTKRTYFDWSKYSNDKQAYHLPGAQTERFAECARTNKYLVCAEDLYCHARIYE